MADPTIEGVLRDFIGDQFASPVALTDLSDEDSLSEAGVVDSAGVLSLIVFLEETFSIRVSDDEVVPANLDSIARMAAFVRRSQSRS